VTNIFTYFVIQKSTVIFVPSLMCRSV